MQNDSAALDTLLDAIRYFADPSDEPASEGRSSLDRLANLTRRVLQVPRSEITEGPETERLSARRDR